MNVRMQPRQSAADLSGIAVVSRRDGKEAVLLNFSHLHIGQGEWIAVTGPNGSGKSTLARLLAGLIRPAAGKVTVKDRPQLVMQNPDAQVIGETVGEDILFGMECAGVNPDDTFRLMEQALRHVGLDVPFDRPVEELSGGQKQLLAIASALVTGASMLILDEVTSMLDPQGRERILQLAARLHRQGTAIVWITQLPDELVHAERIIVLKRGAIAYDGSSRDFFYPSADAKRLPPCDELGMAAPYVVQVVRSLAEQGICFPEPPMTPEQLGEAVSRLCR